MLTFRDRLTDSRPIIHDGGFGSELFRRGVVLMNSSLASESHPDAVVDVHRTYLEAGSESITTNTFVVSSLHLDMAGKDSAEAEKLAALAARQARQAGEEVGSEAYVAGSIGPSPGAIEADGGTDFGIENEKVREAHRRVMGALADEGVDYLCIETMFSAKEAAIAVDEARRSGLPIAVNMTFKSTKDRKTGEIIYRTDWGHGPGDLLDYLAEGEFSSGENLIDSVAVFGANCGAEARDAAHTGMPYAQEAMLQCQAALDSRGITGKRLMAYPNAGLPQLIKGETVYSQTAEEMAEGIGDVLDAGTLILGGCCGTGPDHIRRFKDVVDNR